MNVMPNDIVKFVWAINSYKSLPYLKMAVRSIRENAYYKNQPIVVYTENDEETANWLQFQDDITPIIEYNEVPKGIGGGVNQIVEKIGPNTVMNLIHSDMVISRHYDKPLYDIVSSTDKPIVAGAWRVEPNIWNQLSRPGTIMAPANATDGLGMYHHDFNWDGFLRYADDLVANNECFDFRKVEGVSYMMRTKYFVPNDSLYAPSSFEDHDQSIRMQLMGYDFVISRKAVVWHFGSRASIFLGQSDKLIGRSQRQIECEQKNLQKWLTKWKEMPQFDELGFIKVTPCIKEQWKTIQK